MVDCGRVATSIADDRFLFAINANGTGCLTGGSVAQEVSCLAPIAAQEGPARRARSRSLDLRSGPILAEGNIQSEVLLVAKGFSRLRHCERSFVPCSGLKRRHHAPRIGAKLSRDLRSLGPPRRSYS